MIDVAKEGHKLPAINLAKLLQLCEAVWGAGRFPAQAGVEAGTGADAEAGNASPWPRGTDGEPGGPPAMEAVEAAEMLGQLCLL